MNNSLQAGVGFSRGELELGNEAVDLVKHQARGELLNPGLAENGMGLDVDALDSINKDEGAIAQAGSCGDLTAEVHVAWGVDQVNRVPLAVQSQLRD